MLHDLAHIDGRGEEYAVAIVHQVVVVSVADIVNIGLRGIPLRCATGLEVNDSNKAAGGPQAPNACSTIGTNAESFCVHMIEFVKD